MPRTFEVRIAETVRRVRSVYLEADTEAEAREQAEAGFWDDSDDSAAHEQTISREAFAASTPFEDEESENG